MVGKLSELKSASHLGSTPDFLSHSKIQPTLDLCTQEDSDETQAAQGEFLNAVGMSRAVN